MDKGEDTVWATKMLLLLLLHPRFTDTQKRAWLEEFKLNFDARSTELI